MKLSALRSKLIFGIQDVLEAGGLSAASAHVLCSRCVKDGRMLRLKRDAYVLADRWEHYGSRELLEIANRLQVPSYLSLTTALACHGMTTQVQPSCYESVSLRRSTALEAGGVSFLYHKLQRGLYFGFERKDGIFIAEPEKAVLDGAYLEFLGHAGIDWDALDRRKLNRKRMKKYLAAYPARLRQRMRETCGI